MPYSNLPRFENEMFIKSYANNMAPNSERQMPLYSMLGRGPKGNDAAITIEDVDGVPTLLGKTYNYITEQLEETASMPIEELVPKLHCVVWIGVREIDNVLWWVTYNELYCDIDITISLPASPYQRTWHHEYWRLKTPPAITNQYFGSPDDIPEDSIYQQPQEG